MTCRADLLADAAAAAGTDTAAATRDAFRRAAADAAGRLLVGFDVSAEGVILTINAQFQVVTGWSAGDIAARSAPWMQPGAVLAWIARHRIVEPGCVWAGEAVLAAKDGRKITIDSVVSAVRSLDGQIAGYACVGSDITEAARARDELLRHGKLMQLGQLTATVAHEIRNPLGAIRTASFVLDRKVRGQIDGVAPQLDRINTGIQRCDKIITELLDISRIKALKRQRLNVDDWVVATIRDDCGGLPGDPKIEYSLGLGSTEAAFDPDQMRQVLINLMSNAAEAMAEKRKVDAGYRPVIVVSTATRGTAVEISVADNGPGISPENLARVRQPLFTTKSFGVGLGIPAIERVLENHGGYLEISSVHGDGATAVAGFQRGDALVAEVAAA